MADTKITALTAITSITPATFPLPIVDLLDTTMAGSGTTKKVTVNQILGCGGTATLASATITGDLTVDTSTLKVDSGANKVGFGTTTMNGVLTVKNTSVLSDIPIYTIQGATNTAQLASWTINQNTDVISFGTDYGGALSLKTNSTERYRLAADGVATWSNVGGVAGTAMTLNANGLGVGVTPAAGDGSGVFKAAGTGSGATNTRIGLDVREITTGNAAGIWLGAMNSENTGVIGSRTASGNIAFQTFNGSSWGERMRIDYLGNVGIGITPSAWATSTTVWRALDLQYSCGLASSGAGSGEIDLLWNAYYDQTDQRWEFKYTGLS